MPSVEVTRHNRLGKVRGRCRRAWRCKQFSGAYSSTASTNRIAAIGRSRHSEEGWGIVDLAQTPGGCWVHFSHVRSRGYRELIPGQAVTLECERGPAGRVRLPRSVCHGSLRSTSASAVLRPVGPLAEPTGHRCPERSRASGIYPVGMLDLSRLDLDELATALSDQTDYDHQWLIDPRSGQVAFLTSDTGIDGQPVDLEEVDLTAIDPLPTYVLGPGHG